MRKSYLFLAILTTILGLGFAGYRYFQPKPHDPRVLAADDVNEAETYSNIRSCPISARSNDRSESLISSIFCEVNG
jgi:hypothetical protein